jgi:hypothetical protein
MDKNPVILNVTQHREKPVETNSFILTWEVLHLYINTVKHTQRRVFKQYQMEEG